MAMLKEIMAIVHCSFRALETMDATKVTDNEGVRLISNVHSMIMFSITLSCGKYNIYVNIQPN